VCARNWGTARKVINLFLRVVLYNTYLRRYYSFQIIDKFLEVPIDSFVAKKIKENSDNCDLAKWKGIKHLKYNESMQFQKAAMNIAKQKGIARTHLDLEYWRSK
jgi:hypothetical protein